MLHSFSFENFYSFAGKNTVNFEVSKKAPQNNSYFLTPAQVRLTKIESIIGPNASGKTNALKVPPFFKWLILDSFKLGPSEPLPVKPFLQKNNKPTKLSVEFEINKNIYSYFITLHQQQILQEELKVKNKTKKKTTSKVLFKRWWNPQLQKYSLSADKFNLPKNFQKLLRPNATLISTAMRLNHATSQKIGQFWQNIETNVVEAGWIGDRLFPNGAQNLIEAFDFYSQNKKLKEEAEKLLSQFDLGFKAFKIEKEKKDDGFTLQVQVEHSFGHQKFKLPLNYESAGTKQLFILLKPILQVLSQGGVAVLDELDVNLHPEMINALIELFISPETNPHYAQVIFSTQSHQILSDLDKFQIILVEKNSQGSSEAWRLDEMSGVRADDNYYSKYIAGAYGAVPKIN